MLVIPSLLYVLAGYAVALDKRAVHGHQWARLHYIMNKVLSVKCQNGSWLILERRQ